MKVFLVSRIATENLIINFRELSHIFWRAFNSTHSEDPNLLCMQILDSMLEFLLQIIIFTNSER